MNVSATDHPQTKEILVYKNKCDDLKKEVLVLKSKLLQEVQEKQEMVKKGAVEIVPVASQLVDTEELTRYLSEVSLKEKKITTLKEDKKVSDKTNKEYQIKMPSLKTD